MKRKSMAAVALSVAVVAACFTAFATYSKPANASCGGSSCTASSFSGDYAFRQHLAGWGDIVGIISPDGSGNLACSHIVLGTDPPTGAYDMYLNGSYSMTSSGLFSLTINVYSDSSCTTSAGNPATGWAVLYNNGAGFYSVNTTADNAATIEGHRQ